MVTPSLRDVERTQSLLSTRLDMSLAGLSQIKDNGRCRVYRAFDGGEPVIVKQYRRADAALAREEARALARYSAICEDVPEVMPVRVLAFNPDTSTLCMEHLEGRPLTEVIEEARGDPAGQRDVTRAIALVGALLRRLHETTRRPHVPPSPFLREYLAYVSAGLRSVPLLGMSVFNSYAWDVDVLWDELHRAKEPTSAMHGDPAINNILVRGKRIGLIDFANTNDSAHLLADGYALSVSLRTKRLSDGFRRKLHDALQDGIEGSSYPDSVHRFYWELHRRRWLFLKLVQGNTLAHAQGLRSLSDLGIGLPMREAG